MCRLCFLGDSFINEFICVITQACLMVWQVPVSFNTDEEDHIRDQFDYESTKELQKKIRAIMKNAVLEDFDDE